MSTPSARPLRVGITEDHAPTRQVLEANLSALPGVEVVVRAGSGEEVLRLMAAADEAGRPQVVLMDVELPGMSGIEATAALKRAFPAVDILMLTVFDADDTIFEAIRAGASGYLLKDESPEAILAACRELAQGGAPMSPPVARKTLALLRGADLRPRRADAPADAPEHALTAREVEILEGLAAGHTYASLAEVLFLSPHTVRTHIKNLYRKLHIHSRAEAVQFALRGRRFF